MARYTDDSKERVRDAVDMVDLVGTRVKLRFAGATRYEGLCPFNDERTPSFGIDPAEKRFYCFGCGEGGDAFKFVQLTEGVEFKGALEFLADRYGVQLEVVAEDPAAAERRRARDRPVAGAWRFRQPGQLMHRAHLEAAALAAEPSLVGQVGPMDREGVCTVV